MQKSTKSNSPIHKTFIGLSKPFDIDYPYVITLAGEYVISLDGSFVIAGEHFVFKKTIKSLIDKLILHMATASKTINEKTKIVKIALTNNRFTKQIIKKSKIKKVREFDE